MLERTAGCLETGSLRRLLPGSKKALKSKRALHSCFWSHAAHDLELSPLWAILLRGTESVDHADSKAPRNGITGPASFLLDFLYPAGTLKFLQSCSGTGQDARRTRLLRRLGHRLYTSSTKEISAGHTIVENSQDESPHEARESVGGLANLQRSMNFADYEEIWMQYAKLGEQNQKDVRHQVMRSLVGSSRIADAERVTDLFDKLSPKQRDASAYETVIRAYLRLRDYPRAIELHRSALAICESPAGSDELLAYLIGQNLWSESFTVWSEFQEHRRRLPQIQYGIFRLLKSRPNLPDDVSNLVDVVQREHILANGFKKFAAAVVRMAILSDQHYDEGLFKRWVRIIHQWGFDDPNFYHDCIRLLLKKGNKRLTVRTYRVARQHKGVSFSTKTLHALLEIFCENNSVVGIQEVLDDFFRFHSRLSRIAYSMTINFFARQGDATTVHAMFEQYNKRFLSRRKGHGGASGDLAPLLAVHSRRGELGEVIKYFNQIEEVHKAYPTITCWNILISAYGRVHDIDGAFSVFQRVLASENVQADDWTYATLMAICATHGDRQSVIDIWELSRQNKIEASTTMVDCLVQAHIQDDMLEQAENICEGATTQSLKGPRNYMWNLLVNACAIRLDIANANRIFQRMTELGIPQNELTYAALMQALVMVTRTGHAEDILKNIIPRAGVKITNFHYAILMGGYLGERDYNKILMLHDEMMRRGYGKSAGTRLLALKATVEVTDPASEGVEVKFQQAVELFESVVRSLNPQDMALTPRKGAGHQPLNIAYPTMFYNYFMNVLSKYGDSRGVNELSERFQALLPQEQENSSPLRVLTTLMGDKVRQSDHEGVSRLWELALQRAILDGRPLLSSKPSEDSTNSSNRILPLHQFDLCYALTHYMTLLEQKKSIDLLENTVTRLLSIGFALDTKNWNQYIQILARNYRWKLAFDLCESKLMDGFPGWTQIRQQPHGVPTNLNAALIRPGHWKLGHRRILRPISTTMLHLVRAYLDLQAMAVESRGSEMLLLYLNRQCPRVVEGVKTMPRTNDATETEILGSRW